MATFGDIWRMVRLHAPGAPFSLVRNWTQSAFEELCERRPWTFLSAEARMSTLTSRSLTITFTQERANASGLYGTFDYTISGSFPDGEVRVAFTDANYDPPKDSQGGGNEHDPTQLTWHWDSVQIS